MNEVFAPRTLVVSAASCFCELSLQRTSFDRVPNTTVMFLKVHDKRVIPALNKVDFSKFYKNTAYTEALSLPEIRYLLNEEILGNPGLMKEQI